MNLRTSASYILFFILSFFVFGEVSAQKLNTDSLAAARKRIQDSTTAARKQYYDSIKVARQHFADSVKEVRERRADSIARIRKYRESKRYTDSVANIRKARTDSIRMARQHVTDSIAAIRKKRTDSLAAIRKYKESRKYKDSVARARKARTDSIQLVRKLRTDSIRAERKRVTDSAIAARKHITDSVRAIQKRRTDSLAVIRKYRESKRYKDSVAVVRQQRLDSIKAVRMAFNDSVAADRKQRNDSMAAVRQAIRDSTTAARTKYMDSITAVRKVRTDSLAKLKEKREKDRKARAKNKEEQMQLALELKLKKKRQAWSNEKMLKKKWGPLRQAVQNTFTRYNYYFNTDKKMDEAIDNMLRANRENYDSLLALFPFDPDRDSSLLSQDMDSIIQKASIGIQLHDPRTKWGDDLYLLMGQAYYYKADYENASTAFRYTLSLRDKKKKKSTGYTPPKKNKDGSKTSIVQADNKGVLNFVKHRSVHNEALLWLARTYTEWHQEGNAESVIDILQNDPNFPKSLQGRLAVEKAYLNISQNNRTAAMENLAIVADDKQLPDWLRMRAAYINAQLHEERGEYTAAAQSYKNVIDLHPPIEMDFYARKNLAYNQMYAGVEQEEALAALRRVLKDGKYSNYYEQVYFVMGKLSAANSKNDEAIEYLKKGLTSSRSTKKQKAMSFAALGDVYYNIHSYESAKKYYDSAAQLVTSAPGDSSVQLAVRRSNVLSDITTPINIIHLQDSLVALANMSDKDQRSVVRKYIRSLENARADSIFRAENIGNVPGGDNNQNSGQQGNNYTNWYFANTSLMQQGMNEFKRKWGTRTLADNWRRSAAITSITANKNMVVDSSTFNAGDDESNLELDENGIPTEAALLALIPNATTQKEDALKKLRRAYVDLGSAYIRQLDEYKEATNTFDTLDRRFPLHEHMAEVLYMRYLAAVRQDQLAEARKYSDLLLRDYGNTKWASLVKPTEDGAGLVNTTGNNRPIAEYYDETYDLLIQRQYTQTLQMSRDGQKIYKEIPYQKRFRIIEAISLAGTEQWDQADTVASDFIRKNQQDTLRPWAEAVLSYIKKNRPATPPPSANTAGTDPGGASAGMAPGTAPSSDADRAAAAGDVAPGAAPPPPPPLPGQASSPAVPASYTYKPKDLHYAAIYFRSMDQKSNAVKAAVTDFNTFKFSSLKLTSELQNMNSGAGALFTQSFETALQAKIYMNMLKATPEIFKEYGGEEYEVFIISADNYFKLTNDKDMEAYMKFYRSRYR